MVLQGWKLSYKVYALGTSALDSASDAHMTDSNQGQAQTTPQHRENDFKAEWY
jgi:hypothetical protein